MNSVHHGWSLDEIAPEARRAAERAAEAAGMPLEIWLNQLIKYVSAMELSGKGPARARAIDETIKRAAAEQARFAPGDEGEDAPMMLETVAPPAELPTTLPAEVLEPNRFAEEQPGERDVEQAIGEWRKSGKLKPLVVRADSRKPGHYEIVNGMARWHAASRLHMRRIPVTVQQLSDEEVLRATLIQKLHQKSLPPLDEAQIYQRLMEETGLSVAALSDVIGRSPTHVATALQLLDLPEAVREMINSGELSVLHARTLLGAADPEPAAREVVARRLDIYQTEQLVRASRGAITPPGARGEKRAEAPPHTRDRMAAAPAVAASADTLSGLRAGPPEALPPAERAGGEPPRMDGTAVAPESVAPIPESVAPITEIPAPIPEIPAPIPETPAPIAETPAPIAETLPPIAETFAPIPETPQAEQTPAAPGEPATDEPAASEPETGEAPLDMGGFITADTKAAPEAGEARAPLVLGAGNGDPGALIEASPVIDRPGTSASFDENPVREEPAREAPGEPIAAAPHGIEPEPVNAKPFPSMPDAAEPLDLAPGALTGEAPPADEMPPPGEVLPPGEVPPASDVPSAGASGADGAAASGEPPADARDHEEVGRDDSTRMVETHLSTLLGLKVSIAERNHDDGVLSIHYNSEGELTDLVSRLNRMPTGRRTE
jgi:ParB family transcriptional regulator, chromosome partitioning protein